MALERQSLGAQRGAQEKQENFNSISSMSPWLKKNALALDPTSERLKYSLSA